MTPTEAPVGRLVVCPTPIGNLEDVTLRVLAALGTPTWWPARTPATRGCCSTATASPRRW